jgi:cytochrome c-type biogenesis protein
MVETPSLALAFAAGLVSFLSPCVLPLVPGYLAAVAGRDVAGDHRLDVRTVLRSLLFVATFSAIFIVLGLSATALGGLLFDGRLVLNRVAGAVIVLMGLLFVAALFVRPLNRDWRPGGLAERAAAGGPVLAGAAFAIAWTPCVGPTLGAILGLASTSAGTGRGALLLAVYSAGLALPFLFSALAFDAAQRSFGFFRRHHVAIQAGAGAVLVVMGVLVFTGELFRLNIEVQRWLDGLGANFFQSV